MKKWLLLLAALSFLASGCKAATFPDSTPSPTLQVSDSTQTSPSVVTEITPTPPVTAVRSPTPSPTPKQVKRPRTGGADFHAGVSFLIYGNDTNFKELVVKRFDELIDVNINSVSLVFPLYQKSWDASEVSKYESTLSDENVVFFIKEAKSRGITVMLRPLIDEETLKDKSRNSCKKSPEGLAQWRGNMEPCNKTAWFQSYLGLMLHYAELANSAGADILCLGVELNSMVGVDNASYWRDFIPEIRKEFSGQLTYSNNWNFPQEVGFWDLLDYVGVDAFYRLEAPLHPTEEQLMDAWIYARNILAEAQTAYGKPVLLTEIGVRAEQGAFLHPWYWEHNTPIDLEAQRVFYKTGCSALRQTVTGFYWWHVGLYKPENPIQDPGFDPTSKPAEQALRECYE